MPQTPKSTFSARWNTVMLPEERAMLAALSKDAGLSESHLVRTWIREQYRQRFGKRKPPAFRPKMNSKAARGLA